MEDEKELFEEKRELRSTVMSQKEIAQAEKYLNWYRQAHSDKSSRGLYKKWEEVEAYWEGDLEEPIDDADPCSNTNIVNANVEGKVALLTEQNLAVQVDPIEPSDINYCGRVRILADFIKEKNKMYRKTDIHERRREKFGTGIFRVLWKPKALDGLGLPEIEPLNPAYVFVDPAITDVYKVQEARYIIEITNKSIYQARLKYGDKLANTIIPNYDPIMKTYAFNENGDNDSESYVHIFVWTRYKNKKNEKLELRLVEMSGDGVILSDTKKKEDDLEKPLFPNDTFPYFFTPDMYREGTIWGKGSAELVLPLSDQIDELDNQVLRNARLAGNPQRLVDNNTGIDVEKVTNEPGLVIPTNNINGMKWEIPPSMPQYIINKRDSILQTDRFVVTRFSDQMVGAKQSGVDTATESLALQQAGNTAIEHKKGLLQESMSEVFEYAVELAILNWDSTMLFRVTGEKGEEIFDTFNPYSLNEVPLLIESDGEYRDKYKKANPEALPEEYEYMQNGDEVRKVKYDLKITVGAGLPNNKAFRYSLMLESMGKQIISRKECRKYLIENMGLNLPAVPESMQEQQETGIFDSNMINQMPVNDNQQIPNDILSENSDIKGLNANGNVSINSVKEGVI